MLRGFYVQTYFKMFLILIHFNSDWNRKSIFCVLIRDYLGHYSYFDEFQTNFNIKYTARMFRGTPNYTIIEKIRKHNKYRTYVPR